MPCAVSEPTGAVGGNIRVFALRPHGPFRRLATVLAHGEGARYVGVTPGDPPLVTANSTGANVIARSVDPRGARPASP